MHFPVALLAVTETKYLHHIWGLLLSQSVTFVIVMFLFWGGSAGAAEDSWEIQNPGGAAKYHTQRIKANPSNEIS